MDSNPAAYHSTTSDRRRGLIAAPPRAPMFPQAFEAAPRRGSTLGAPELSRNYRSMLRGNTVRCYQVTPIHVTW